MSQFPMRGAIPSPRSALAAATPHIARAGAPPNFVILPAQISMWGNYYNADCVTAEEAFAKACNSPEILISDNEVVSWATSHGVLNGAYLTQVLQWMQNDGFHQGGVTYDDGPYYSVDWTNATTLQSAISNGPVKLGVAGDQLSTTWNASGGNQNGGKSGWFALGYHADSNEDHCVSICGYGTINWLAQQLHVGVPGGIDGTKPGYALFTWDSIGIIDEPSLLAITHEAWLRQPTTRPTAIGTLLLYDPSESTGAFYSVNAAGGMTLLQQYNDWRQTWGLAVTFSNGTLLLYDRNAGTGAFYSVNAAGGMTLLQQYNDWRKTWDLAVTFSNGTLLLYDRSAGTGAFYSVNAAGGMTLLQQYNDWRKTWDLAVDDVT